MSAQLPDSQFYDDVANATLWRDLSRLFEDFLPDVASEERRTRFQAVLSDIDGRLSEADADMPVRCEKMEGQTDLQCVKAKHDGGNCSRCWSSPILTWRQRLRPCRP